MGFGQAISTCFGKYATFSGRARRSEYWYWVLFVVIVSIVTNLLDSLLGTRTVITETGSGTLVTQAQFGWITTIFALVVLLPSIAVAVRRLHDTGRIGWWYLLTFICCIGQIILIVFFVQDSAPDNQYGPNPKAFPATPPGPTAA